MVNYSFWVSVDFYKKTKIAWRKIWGDHSKVVSLLVTEIKW